MDQSKVEASTCSRREAQENSRQQAIIVLVYFWLAEKRARYFFSQSQGIAAKTNWKTTFDAWLKKIKTLYTRNN